VDDAISQCSRYFVTRKLTSFPSLNGLYYTDDVTLSGVPGCGEVHEGDLWRAANGKVVGRGCTSSPPMGLYLSPQGVESGDPRGGYAPPGKCKLHAENVKFGANFRVLLLFKLEIIVDSKLPGDLVQVPGAGKLTPVSGRLLGIPGDLRPTC